MFYSYNALNEFVEESEIRKNYSGILAPLRKRSEWNTRIPFCNNVVSSCWLSLSSIESKRMPNSGSVGKVFSDDFNCRRNNFLYDFHSNDILIRCWNW
ncbi:hypothetical protein [Clostridium sp. SHJSY1]|uniref:hypothetical protein n=1 Tax=Clostridium sp. SHJSY1 TaxID=2942483 RepID=UPI00287B709D|nr:hypothetical protein [Clostridium sp. SHJSY1]